MKYILCYGDSNTWGYVPLGYGKRYPAGVRWTSVLQEKLGKDYYVYEQGLCGRTTVYNDPDLDYRVGSDALPMTLDICAPLDLIMIMLGTNDVKPYFGQTAAQITEGLETLIKQIKDFPFGPDMPKPEILIVAPAHVRDTLYGSDMEFFADKVTPMFDDSAIKLSKELAPLYEALAEKYGCHFLDAGKLIEASDGDGVHLSPESHAVLGEAVYNKVKSII